VNELWRPNDRRLSPKLVPTFVDRVWYMVSVTDPTFRKEKAAEVFVEIVNRYSFLY
jgi:hypothetical protein